MTLKQRVAREFLYRESPAQQVAIGGHIVQSLTANAVIFPALPVPVATLNTTNATYLTLIQEAKEGSHSAIAARNNQAKVWKSQFKATADYVDSFANGDAVIITKAGMTPTKAESAPRQLPAQPVNPKVVRTDQAGVAEIVLRPDTNVDAYLYLAIPDGVSYTIGPDGMLTLTVGAVKIFMKCDTHATTVLANLTTGQALQMLAQPVNNVGAGPASVGMTVTPL